MDVDICEVFGNTGAMKVAIRLKAARGLLICALVSLLVMPEVRAQSSTWNSATGGNWTDNTKWTGNFVPNGKDDTATLGSIISSNQTINVNSPVTVGTLNINDNNSYTVSGSQLTLDVSSGSAAINVRNSGSPTIASSIKLNDNAIVDNTGTGLFTISGVISGSHAMTYGGTGTTVLSGLNSYTGVTTITGGVLSVSNLANGVANSNIGASSSGAGSLVLDGGTLAYSGSGSTSNRMFTIGAGGASIASSGTGALNLNGTGALGYSGTGARTLTLTGSNSATNTLSADLADAGTGSVTSLVKDGSGTWQISGTNTLTGTVTVNNGLLQLNSSAVNGGAPNGLVVGDGLGAADSAIARVMHEGQVGNTSTLTVRSDGLFDINAAGYADTGGVANYREETVGQINLYGGHIVTGNPGSLNIDASLPGAGIASFSSSQTAVINATGGVVDFKGLARTISVEQGSQVTDLEIRGNLANGGVTKTGAGQLSFTGTEANTYTGPTRVDEGTLNLAKSNGVNSIAGSAITVNCGGTLLLSSSEQINNTAGLNLAGGTLATANIAGIETLGALTLSGTSSIDLGTAAYLLQFANSSSLSSSWSGSLTIYGWTGVPNASGTAGQLFFGNNISGLTSSQLSMISFNGFGGSAILLTSGELVPMAVPEAQTVVAALLLILLVLSREIRPIFGLCRRLVT